MGSRTPENAVVGHFRAVQCSYGLPPAHTRQAAQTFNFLWATARTLRLCAVQDDVEVARGFLRIGHQSLLVGKMHITPQQAWESFPQAQSPTDPLDPDVIWQRVVDYDLANNPLAQPPAKKNDPGEAATSPKAETVRAITTPGTSHTDTPTIDPQDAVENYRH